MNYNIDGYSKKEGRVYIEWKLKKAVCTNPVFDDATIEVILNASDSPCNHALQCLTSDSPQPICRPHYIRHCHTGNQRHHSWLKRRKQFAETTAFKVTDIPMEAETSIQQSV